MGTSNPVQSYASYPVVRSLNRESFKKKEDFFSTNPDPGCGAPGEDDEDPKTESGAKL